MRVDFKNMPDNSRIWIYQSDRDLNESEISIIDDKTTSFLTLGKHMEKILNARIQLLTEDLLLLQ